MAHEHLLMLEEELESVPEDPIDVLEESFAELDLTNKPPSLMTRLAKKMKDIADAEKLIADKRNAKLEASAGTATRVVPVAANPFSAANREAQQQKAL